MNDYTQKCNHPEIRELTLANGIAYPSDEELVMLILGKGTKDNPIEQLSEKVIQAINASNEDNLVENLTAIDGMGSSRALAISAAIELGRRRKGFLHSIIRKPKDVVPYIKHYSLMKSEHFITITTNGAHEIIGSKSKDRSISSEMMVDPLVPCSPCLPSACSLCLRPLLACMGPQVTTKRCQSEEKT